MSGFRNTDPFMPWNDPISKNNPFKPWNDPFYRYDPFAPWNQPFADERDIREYERFNHVKIEDKRLLGRF